MILWLPKEIEEGESHFPFFYPEGASLKKKAEALLQMSGPMQTDF